MAELQLIFFQPYYSVNVPILRPAAYAAPPSLTDLTNIVSIGILDDDDDEPWWMHFDFETPTEESPPRKSKPWEYIYIYIYNQV